MAVEWSGLGPDLLLTVDRASRVPLRAQLEDQLRTAVRSGRLVAGEKVPSSRELAGGLGLSRGIVQDCYAQLQAEGYFTSRGGSATRVAPTAIASAPHPGTVASPPPARPRLIADFQSGVPDLGMAPREDWAWAMREACRTVPTSAFDYGDPAGDQRLRYVLAAYLRRVRAADADAARLVVCGGFAQGLGLALRALTRSGVERVAFEDPGSVGSLGRAIASAGAVPVPVPVDPSGIDVDHLAASGARAVVVTPAHQWPTGVVLSPERRHALIGWAREHDGYVLEDDYDAEFRYDREPVGSLQGLAPDRVISLGTVSKSLAPALRLGWAVVPSALASELVAQKAGADRGTPGPDQAALAILMESGRYDRHLRRMRAVYAKRRDALVGALTRHAPRVTVTGLAAGFHAVAHLPSGTGEADVVRRAHERGVGLYGMSAHRADHSTVPGQLVLGFGNTSERAIVAGISAVADLLA